VLEILKGKKSEFLEESEFLSGLKDYSQIIIDIGTGNGKFIYEKAKNNPENFYIGIDPNRKALEKFSSKIYKKPEKGGVSNAVYIISNIESLNEKLENIAHEIFIINPWGSLLSFSVNAAPHFLEVIKRIAKNNSSLKMYFNYSSKYEPQTMEKLEIEDLHDEYIEKFMKKEYLTHGIEILEFKKLTNEEFKEISAQWSKKLGFGRERTVWEISGKITKNLSYSFGAKGHKNILAEHPKTLEFTKDKSLTKRGDCIVGIEADFELGKLQQFQGWIDIEISVNEISQKFKSFVNPNFSSSEELVFRKSKVGTDRTFGIMTNFASNKIDRRIIELLQNENPLKVTITQRQKKVHRNKYR
jgi:16S rRNA (adenine(1408)-N(1))-methyltransferase